MSLEVQQLFNRGGGGGMCCKNGSLSMGPIFHEKIPNYGSDVQNLQCVLWPNCKKWVPFSDKFLNKGTYFCKKLPQNMGIGLELPAAHP